jgi:hypothetical protein
MALFVRQAQVTCQAPLQLWVCASPNFRGCCSIDACVNYGCPDVGNTGAGMNANAPGYIGSSGGKFSTLYCSFIAQGLAIS